MALTDMAVFNKQVQVVATETVDQAVRKFNEASAGTLIMGSGQHIGDFLEEASYKLIAGLVARRNAYGTGAVTTTPITQMTDRAVKVDGRIGPIEWTLEQFNRLAKSEEEAGLIIGEQAAEALIQDYLNTGAASLVGAIGAQASLNHTAAAGATLNELNTTAGKFGDRSQSIAAWLMHSTVYHALIGQAITNANRLFTIGDIQVVQDGLGRRYVVTDSPALVAAPDYKTLGLVAGALQVETGPIASEMLPALKGENIGKIWQGEYSFTTGLKGYAWDAAAGGKSPNDTALATGTNWPKIVTSDKDTAGVMLTSTGA